MGRVHIESLDVLKAKEQLDLQYISENTRRDDVYRDLNEIIDRVTKLPVFPSLMWVWAFDIMKEIFDNYQIKDLAVNDYVDEGVPEGITLKQIFDKFWADVDGFGLSMDSGGDIIEETIRDWMRDNNFLVSLEEEDDE
jgi:hypothetical protein